MKKRIFALISILIIFSFATQVAVASNSSLVIPLITITDVVVGTSVTIKAVNFPTDDDFKVTMGAFGTRGVGGIVVADQNSGTGSFTATYTIPASLASATRIAIRLESPTSHYYSYNWFWNNTTSGGTGTTWGYPPAGAGTIPSTKVTNVNPGVDVEVEGSNFTTTDTYDVYIGKFGTKGVGGVKVGTQDTDANGKFTGTYAIPASLQAENKLAIRFVSPAAGYYAYDWFYNQGSPTPGTTWGYPPKGANTIPTFTITKVVQGVSVTINATNFTTNDSYTVTMGVMGSKGVGGVKVATQATDGTGTFTETYNIPASLKTNSMIAIRLQSPNSGYYSYNWFYNNTYP